MIIFPSSGAFKRQHGAGLIPIIFDSVKNNNIKLKVMLPMENRISELIEKLKSEKEIRKTSPDIEFRNIENLLETRSTIRIVDRRISLSMELKDDSRDSFYDAIGLSTYSNSKAGVLSYVFLFENL